MENWKSIRNVIISLAVLFTVDFIFLILMLPKINLFVIGTLIIFAIVGIYFTSISWMLLKKLVEYDAKLNNKK